MLKGVMGLALAAPEFLPPEFLPTLAGGLLVVVAG
jgi:hypothetical protein